MKNILNTPAAKLTIGLLIGAGLLLLVSRFVNIPATLHVLLYNLATPRGLLLALLAGVAFLMAFATRGTRWSLFLKPIGNVNIFTAIRIFFVSIFINFLLPISGGEVAKALILKRIAAIPISRSLPTIVMDRSMDLLPAFFIIAIVPLLGIQMDVKLWFVLAFVISLLFCLMAFTALALWKRTAAIALLRKVTAKLPAALREKIAGFAVGFVDSLLVNVNRPRIFVPAALLTCVAVVFDALFAMFAFWTVGYPISLGTVVFGYTLYNMFFIFPTPPGQIGSNEAVGLLIFTGLLHLPSTGVIAMFVFSHPWAALLMCVAGVLSLKTLGLTIPTAMRVQAQESDTEGELALLQEERGLLSSEEQEPVLSQEY